MQFGEAIALASACQVGILHFFQLCTRMVI